MVVGDSLITLMGVSLDIENYCTLGSFFDHQGVRLENGIYGHSRFCNTDFDDKLACLNLSGV